MNETGAAHWMTVSAAMRSPPIAAVGLISLVLALLAARGVSAPLVLVLASFVVFSYVVLASGRLLLRAARASDLPLVAAWPLGAAVTGLALLGLIALLSVSAAVAFALWGVAIFALDVATASSHEQAPAPARADLVGLALCCAVVLIWCKDLAAVPATLAESGRFPAWTDYFLHAGVISQFGDARAIGRGGIWLADTPWVLYHYASYTLPAVFAWPLDQPGLPLATSIWTPIGILCLAGAAYTLGGALAGPAGGVAALAALFVLPDASNYGLRNGFFSFHWNLLAQPTSAYAVGTGLLSIVFLDRWVQTRSRAAFAISVVLALATALLRAHIFLLFFPAWLVAVALASRLVSTRRILFLALTGALAIGAVLALRLAPPLPVEVSWVFDEGRALERFLHFVHRRQEPTAYQGVYQRIVDGYGENAGFAAGILLVYPACLGVLVILYPLALFLLRGQLRWAGIDGFPLLLLVAYAALMLLAPIPAHHDATDFTHRPFVLVYALTAAWTAGSLARWLSAQGGHGARLWQTLLAATVFALPLVWVNAAEMARPKFYWSRPFAAHTVPPELLAAADFLRDRALPGETFAAWPLTTGRVGTDAPTELVALTGLPAYLARPWIHEVRGSRIRVTALERYRALDEAARAQDPENAARTLRNLKVRWFVVVDPLQPRWDPRRRHAVWARGAVAIYDSAGTPVSGR